MYTIQYTYFTYLFYSLTEFSNFTLTVSTLNIQSKLRTIIISYAINRFMIDYVFYNKVK